MAESDAAERRPISKDDLARAAAKMITGKSTLERLSRLDGCCTQGCCDDEVIALLD